MYKKYLAFTVQNLYATIPETSSIVELFEKGLAMNNACLAGSAMEELLRRGDSSMIIETLDKAFTSGWIVEDSNFVPFIARTISENARKVDPILWRYGKNLSHEFMSPSEWFSANTDKYKCICPDGELEQAIKQADEELAAKARRQQLAADSFREFTETL